MYKMVKKSLTFSKIQMGNKSNSLYDNLKYIPIDKIIKNC